MIIALHGDFATAEMLQRDVGDLACTVDLFFDAKGWTRFSKRIDKLIGLITQLDDPPILIGYSRGGSAIAALSELVEIKAAVVYESPVLDSDSVGGTFPVLQIWNDRGARYGLNEHRRQQSIIADQLWAKNHQVTQLIGTGGHIRRNPLGHFWDCELNPKIRDWMVNYDAVVGITYFD